MNRRILQLLTLWMLPLLVARAIVPVGFMFMSDAQGLRLMFCPTVVQMDSSLEARAQQARAQQARAQASHEMHSGHEMHHEMSHAAQMDHAPGDGAPKVDHDKAPCPFSLVASAAPLDLTYVVVLATLVGERFDTFQTPPDLSVAPVQSLPIRGPPQYS